MARISAGTVKLLAPSGAIQRKRDVELEGRSTPVPAMKTDAFGSPPDQESVIPPERVIEEI